MLLCSWYVLILVNLHCFCKRASSDSFHSISNKPHSSIILVIGFTWLCLLVIDRKHNSRTTSCMMMRVRTKCLCDLSVNGLIVCLYLIHISFTEQVSSPLTNETSSGVEQETETGERVKWIFESFSLNIYTLIIRVDGK